MINIEFTPKSLFAPKSPEGDFLILLDFNAFPLGIKGKKALNSIKSTFRNRLNTQFLLCRLFFCRRDV